VPGSAREIHAKKTNNFDINNVQFSLSLFFVFMHESKKWADKDILQIKKDMRLFVFVSVLNRKQRKRIPFTALGHT